MRSAVVKANRQTISLAKAGTVAGFLRRPVSVVALTDRRAPRPRAVVVVEPRVPVRSEIVFRAGAVTIR